VIRSLCTVLILNKTSIVNTHRRSLYSTLSIFGLLLVNFDSAFPVLHCQSRPLWCDAVWSVAAAAQPDDEVRFCYECSGFQCLQNPQDPSLFPGRVRCHPVMDYCTTHIRYTPSNHSLGLSPSTLVAVLRTSYNDTP